MNVMLTCAGRRGHIVTAFKEAIGGRGQVFACDSSADAPALQEADRAFVVPSVNDDSYIDALLVLCDRHRVNLLLPALEPELPMLAQNRARFRAVGTTLLVSEPEIIATCYDKLKTADFLAGCGLLVPQTFDSLEAAREALSLGQASFPLVVKPRWGVSSIGTHVVEDHEELDLAYKLTKKQVTRTFFAEMSATDPDRCILIQERLVGIEYGLDVINDLDGNHVCTFPKQKLRMRAGQTDRAMTVCDERLDGLGRLLGEQLQHVGMLDCDVFVTDRGLYVIDMNPRVGGGYPFSHLAGANFPAAVIAWASGEEPEPRWFEMEPGMLASRCESFLRHVSEQSAATDPRTVMEGTLKETISV